MIAEFLNETENVILRLVISLSATYPSTAVQTRRMFAQFIDEFFHFKGSRDRFNETSASNGTSRHSDRILRYAEDIIP